MATAAETAMAAEIESLKELVKTQNETFHKSFEKAYQENKEHKDNMDKIKEDMELMKSSEIDLMNAKRESEGMKEKIKELEDMVEDMKDEDMKNKIKELENIVEDLK